MIVAGTMLGLGILTLGGKSSGEYWEPVSSSCYEPILRLNLFNQLSCMAGQFIEAPDTDGEIA